MSWFWSVGWTQAVDCDECCICLISVPSKDCAPKNPETTFYLGTPAPEPQGIFAFGGNTGPMVSRRVPELLWLPRCEMRMPICMEPRHFCGPLGNCLPLLWLSLFHIHHALTGVEVQAGRYRQRTNWASKSKATAPSTGEITCSTEKHRSEIAIRES